MYSYTHARFSMAIDAILLNIECDLAVTEYYRHI